MAARPLALAILLAASKMHGSCAFAGTCIAVPLALQAKALACMLLHGTVPV